MKTSMKIPYLAAAAIVIVGSGVGAYYGIEGSKKPQYSYSPVGRGDLVRSVALTGAVRPTEAVDLAFERGGRIVRISVDVGAKVTAGQALAFLDASDLKAQMDQAQASLDGAKARYADLQRGLRPEESGVEDVKVAGAQATLAQAQTSAVDKLTAAYATADDAVRGKIDPLFLDPTGTSPKLAFFVADASLETQIGWDRLLIEILLKDWQASTSKVDVGSDLHAATSDARAKLAKINDFLTETALAIDKLDLSANPDLQKPTVDGYKANLSLARANIAAVSASLSGADQQLAAAEAGLQLAQSSRALKVAGASDESLAAQDAAVRQAEASVEAVGAQLAKTVIRSPIDGVVTRQDGHVGQIAAPGAAFLSVISDQAFEVKADASEADVADIHVGDAATVTLDAYGDTTVFDADVSAVDPAETTTDGVPSYRVTLRFKEPDGRIKSGMTANTTISAGSRKDVVVIPKEDVVLRDADAYVLVEGNDGPEQRKVTLGLRGSDGRIEVVSGLQEGEKVADFGGRK